MVLLTLPLDNRKAKKRIAKTLGADAIEEKDLPPRIRLARLGRELKRTTKQLLREERSLKKNRYS